MSNYWNKREALVNIAHELMNRGWKVYGYKEDRSDSMTDYFDPAAWDGIAEKNGFILVVDNNFPSEEREITKYNPKGNLSHEDQEKIKKLEQMTQEKGATEGEEENAKILIEKLKAKISNEPQYIVVGKIPGHMANPGKSKWHIEKDGKIYDKGTGIVKFADLPSSWQYDINKMEFKDGYKTVREWSQEKNEWEWVERTLPEETIKVINSFKNLILRFERVVSGQNSCGDGTVETEQAGKEQQQNEGLEKIIVKEVKQVVKPIQKDDITINLNDVLSFPYHGHYWMVVNKYQNSKGQDCVVYECLGSAKRGYQRLKNGKRYYQLESRLIKELEEGKTKIYTLQEVEEVNEVEKWVKVNDKKNYKKQESKQNQEVNTTQEQAQEQNNSQEPATKKQRWALHVASKRTVDTREIDITKEQASDLINRSQNGEDITAELKWLAELETEEQQQEEQIEQQEVNNNMRDKQNVKNIYFKSWDKSEEQINIELQTTGYIYKLLNGKFYIKVTPETYQDIYNTLEKINQYNGAILFDSEIDYTVSQEEISKQFNNNRQQDTAQEEEQEDDILNKFDNLEFENTDRIEEEDKEFCEKHQQDYNEAILMLNNFILAFKDVSGIDLLDKRRYNQESKNKYLDWYKFDKVAELARETKKNFINNIVWHFTEKYSITIKSETIFDKYNFNITYDNIIDEIFIQLDGFTFKEKADKEIKDKLKNEIRYEKIKINNNKFTIPSYASFEKAWNGKDYRITYYGRDRLVALFKALTHFDSGKTNIYNDFQEFISYNNEQSEDYWFTEFDFSYKNKMQAIRFYKNGKIDIKFKSNQQAQQFAKQYCGYMEKVT